MMKKWISRFWFIPPVIIGVALVLLAPNLGNPPKQVEAEERAVKVRVIKVPELDVLLKTTGYGATRPGRTWEAVAQVAGQVVWVSEKLKDGEFVEAGVELLRIDDSTYRLALAEVEARLKAIQVKDQATRASLTIAERDLKLLETELKRSKSLASRGTTAQTAIEAVERKVLNGEVVVQNLRNALAINAAEREVLIPQKSNAELNLGYTSLKAPFDVRIGEVKIGRIQYANKGQLLFSGDGIDVVEVEARFPIGRLRPLMAGTESRPGAIAGTKAPGALDLTAVLRLHTGLYSISWEARVDRVSGTIDPQTQTLGIVAAVDDPYSKAEPGKRPSLARNTFVEVELLSKLQTRQLVVPLLAIHGNTVYLLDKDNRLVIRPVKIKFIQGSYAILAEGVKPGERLVLSDLIPAVKGMLLDPEEDKRARKQIMMEAASKEGSQ